MDAVTTPTGPMGPERRGGQGLDHNQEESGNLAIEKLLLSDDGRAWTDFVATYRESRDGAGAYEAWALRGMVRWTRHLDPGGGYRYEIIEQMGENPLENQDHRALSTLADELAAGRHVIAEYILQRHRCGRRRRRPTCARPTTA